jgi:hypothetical protein
MKINYIIKRMDESMLAQDTLLFMIIYRLKTAFNTNINLMFKNRLRYVQTINIVYTKILTDTDSVYKSMLDVLINIRIALLTKFQDNNLLIDDIHKTSELINIVGLCINY